MIGRIVDPTSEPGHRVQQTFQVGVTSVSRKNTTPTTAREGPILARAQKQ